MDGFFADIHEDEHVWIGERLNRPVEPTQAAIGTGEQGLQFVIDLQRRLRRERSRIKGPVALRLLSPAAGSGRVRYVRCVQGNPYYTRIGRILLRLTFNIVPRSVPYSSLLDLSLIEWIAGWNPLLVRS